MFITSKLEIELGLNHMLILAESVILVSRILKFIAQRDQSIQVMELILMAPLQMEDTLVSLSSMKGDQRTLVNLGSLRVRANCFWLNQQVLFQDT